MAQLGNAGFTYQPEGENVITFNLSSDIQFDIRGARSQQRERAVSLDFERVDVARASGNVNEVIFRTRFEEEPRGLHLMFEAGWNGVLLRYHEDLSSNTDFPSFLLGVSDKMRLPQDSDRFGFAEWQREFRLRHAGGGNYNQLL